VSGRFRRTRCMARRIPDGCSPGQPAAGGGRSELRAEQRERQGNGHLSGSTSVYFTGWPREVRFALHRSGAWLNTGSMIQSSGDSMPLREWRYSERSYWRTVACSRVHDRRGYPPLGHRL